MVPTIRESKGRNFLKLRQLSAMAEPKTKLHIAMFPWLAFGHMIPFLQLAKVIVQKGHRVSFISTPRNISRLPKISSHLSPSITFVPLTLPTVDNLPEDAEATTDLPETHVPYLKEAFDRLSGAFCRFLEASHPDWIIYDFAQYWVPPIAEKLGVSRAFFCTFNASSLSMIGGSGQDMILGCDPRKIPEDLTVVPPWVPFDTNIVYRLFEAKRFFQYPTTSVNPSGLNDNRRASLACSGCEVFAVRTCTELEAAWIRLLGQLHGKQVVPTGLLLAAPVSSPNSNTWQNISGWMDKQSKKSVVYVALGTEVTVTRDDMFGLAHGLELCGLPFLWAISKSKDTSGLLPDGFKERNRGRGLIWTGWAPQAEVLSHESVGGFVTHCGWGSVVEGLSFGRPLIMFPCNLDQPLVARFLAEMNVGLEIPRNDEDGSFTSASVADTIRTVVTKDEGKIYRDYATSMMKKVFGNKKLQQQYADNFIQFLENHRAGILSNK